MTMSRPSHECVETRVVIRPASPTNESDIFGICRVGGETYKATFSWQVGPEEMEYEITNTFGPEQVKKDLEDPAKRTWVAEDPVHGVIGFVTACMNNPETDELDAKYENPVELQRLYTSLRHHKGGIGQRLISTTLEWAKAEGYKSVWLGVAGENEVAMRFYAKNGFVRIGEHSFKWASGRVDVDQVMAKVL